MLGGSNQPSQQDEYQVDPNHHTGKTGQYRIGQEGASFLDPDQPEQGESYE